MMPTPTGNIDNTAGPVPSGKAARSTAGEFEALLSQFGKRTFGKPDVEAKAGTGREAASPPADGARPSPATAEAADPDTRQTADDPDAATRLLAARDAAAPGAPSTAAPAVPAAARPGEARPAEARQPKTGPLARPTPPAAAEAPRAGKDVAQLPFIRSRGTTARPAPDTTAETPPPVLRLKERIAQLPGLAAATSRHDANSAAQPAPTEAPAATTRDAAALRTTLRAGFLGRAMDDPERATTPPRPGDPDSPDKALAARRDAPRAEVRPAGPAPARAAEAGQMPAKPLGEVSVTRREVHLAPVRRPAAIENHLWQRQLPAEPLTPPRTEVAARPTFAAVAEQLTQALEPLRAEAEAKLQQATQNALASARAYAPPVRVVELSLQPASLGAVAVTMRLSGSGLRILVSASNRATADLLREDREALASLIEGVGYDAREIIVTHRPPRETATA
ncbi:MAG: hypothetical protein AcusKO_20490 [Acuticoccus sp.]